MTNVAKMTQLMTDMLIAARAEGRAAGLEEAAHKTQAVRDELAGYLPPGAGRDGAFGALDEAMARIQAMARALAATSDGAGKVESDDVEDRLDERGCRTVGEDE